MSQASIRFIYQHIPCYHEASSVNMSPAIMRLMHQHATCYLQDSRMLTCHLLSLCFMCKYVTYYQKTSCVKTVNCHYNTCLHGASCVKMSPTITRFYVQTCHLLSQGFMCHLLSQAFMCEQVTRCEEVS